MKLLAISWLTCAGEMQQRTHHHPALIFVPQIKISVDYEDAKHSYSNFLARGWQTTA